MGVPTCNRPEALERSLESYLCNFERYGRSVKITIADDSRSAAMRQKYRSVLQRFQADYPKLQFQYLGLEEKLRFAKRLIEDSGVPSEVIKFACFDSEQTGLGTFGANRNFLLMQHAGQMFVTVDDDTVCSIARAPGFESRIESAVEERFSSSHPCECWVYSDLDQLLGAYKAEQQDFLGLHESILGREVADACKELRGRHGAEVGAAAEHQWLAGEGRRVAVTFNGLAGDCATPSPTNYLLFVGKSLRRFVEDPAAYQKAILSRQIVRVADRFIITRRTTNTPGLFTGLDGREFLPPYVPVGRGEDLVYWNLLDQTLPTLAFGFLPWSLLHLPVDKRTFWPGEIGRSASGVSLDVFLSVLIRSWKGESTSSAETNLRKLGERLCEIGRLPPREFDRLALAEAQKEMKMFIAAMEAKLEEFRAANSHWRADQERFIETARHTAENHNISIPLDVLFGRSVDQARVLVQRLVLRIGELFYWWPQIVASAVRLG